MITHSKMLSDFQKMLDNVGPIIFKKCWIKIFAGILDQHFREKSWTTIPLEKLNPTFLKKDCTNILQGNVDQNFVKKCFNILKKIIFDIFLFLPFWRPAATCGAMAASEPDGVVVPRQPKVHGGTGHGGRLASARCCSSGGCNSEITGRGST